MATSRPHHPDQRHQHPLTRVGKMFEDNRLARGWSHEETGKRAGVKSPSTYGTVIYGGRFDQGRFRMVRTSAKTIARFAMALGLDVPRVLRAAGYKSVPQDITYNLKVVPSDQMLGELARRGELPGDTPGR